MYRINRYRLIATIEADIFFLGVGTMIGVLSLSWFILGASGVGFLMTGAIMALVLFLYIQYKEKNKKGFLMHWLYSRGLWRPKYKRYFKCNMFIALGRNNFCGSFREVMNGKG